MTAQAWSDIQRGIAAIAVVALLGGLMGAFIPKIIERDKVKVKVKENE